jgi:hypothetical protein
MSDLRESIRVSFTGNGDKPLSLTADGTEIVRLSFEQTDELIHSLIGAMRVAYESDKAGRRQKVRL